MGEIVDKLSILTIKLDKIKDEAKLANVRREHKLLRRLFDQTHDQLVADLQVRFVDVSMRLKNVNEKIWVIEDDIRDHEKRKNFGPTFVELARGVYHNNDERAALKRELNELVGSRIIEEKSYTDYK